MFKNFLQSKFLKVASVTEYQIASVFAAKGLCFAYLALTAPYGQINAGLIAAAAAAMTAVLVLDGAQKTAQGKIGSVSAKQTAFG